MKNEKPNFNINFDKDEYTNEYIYCWSKMGSKPSRIKLNNYFDPNEFIKYISEFNTKLDSTLTEVFPIEDGFVLNDKVLIQLRENIYVSYIHHDKGHESSIISDVVIIHKLGTEESDELIKDITQLSLDIKEDSHRINTVSISSNVLVIDPIEIKSDFDDIEYYYNDDVLKSVDKLIKTINKTNKGISIISGEMGSGKTELLFYISSLVNKIVINIPSTMIESTVNNTDFRALLKIHKNALIIIDDFELYSNSQLYVNNILQLVDGFESDNFNVNIILSLNSKKHKVNEVLTNCNNLIDHIFVSDLKKEKANVLAKKIDSGIKYDSSSKLINVLNFKNIKPNELGY